MEATGTAQSLAELAEQLAWLGAALRLTSDLGLGYASFEPFIEVSTSNDPSRRSSFGIGFKPVEYSVRSPWDLSEAGRCWLGLFRSPVLVLGFPILRRPTNEWGLEIPLSIVAQMIGARFVTRFNSGIFTAGFNAMLALQRQNCEHNVNAWHLVVKTDGAALTYEEAEMYGSKFVSSADIMSSGFKGSRHIVGWCSNVENHAGKSGHLQTRLEC